MPPTALRGGVAGESGSKLSVASVQTCDVATDGKQYTTAWGLANKVKSKMYDQSCLSLG